MLSRSRRRIVEEIEIHGRQVVAPGDQIVDCPSRFRAAAAPSTERTGRRGHAGHSGQLRLPSRPAPQGRDLAEVARIRAPTTSGRREICGIGGEARAPSNEARPRSSPMAPRPIPWWLGRAHPAALARLPVFPPRGVTSGSVLCKDLICFSTSGVHGRRQCAASASSVSSMPRKSRSPSTGWSLQLVQARAQREQAPGQIAAVHGRDVLRVERKQGAACRTSCRNGRGSARASPSSSEPGRSCARARRRRCIRNRAPPDLPEAPCPCSWGRARRRCSETDTPGSCRAAASCARGRQNRRRTATYAGPAFAGTPAVGRSSPLTAERSGLLIHQPTMGDDQPEQQHRDHERPSGHAGAGATASTTARTMARSGAIHISRRKPSGVRRALRRR